MATALRQTSADRRNRPLLENGDRLDSAEFLRRFEALPRIKKAELIEGEVYMPSPVRLQGHAEPHSFLMAWLTNYQMFTPGVRAGDNATVRLGPRHVAQPDGLLFIPADRGGQATVDRDGYVTGPPELVAEVASSSVSIDVGRKKQAYRKGSVTEYLVWRVEDEAIDWYRLRRGVYFGLRENKGVLKSDAFPGLWLNRRAMLAGDLKAVFETLKQGVATAEHAQFTKRLAGTR